MRILGIDEVGRGCWAGPLVAGAVVLPDGWIHSDTPVVLRDSKTLSARQRQIAADYIYEHALAVGLGWVWPAEIDEIGLTAAVGKAMRLAYGLIAVPYEQFIIDGSINYIPENPLSEARIQADASVPSVSAASILAKVARDTYMANLGEQYAGYGFAQHVGYGTATHRAALQRLGVSDIHRKSYKPIRLLLES
jgi:ribonuclease HII